MKKSSWWHYLLKPIIIFESMIITHKRGTPCLYKSMEMKMNKKKKWKKEQRNEQNRQQQNIDSLIHKPKLFRCFAWNILVKRQMVNGEWWWWWIRLVQFFSSFIHFIIIRHPFRNLDIFGLVNCLWSPLLAREFRLLRMTNRSFTQSLSPWRKRKLH